MKFKKIKAFIQPPPSRYGFTLIGSLFLISIILGLLTILGLSLTSKTRVVGLEKNREYARRSALFGLKTALGELQATAGPDQRITATADILSSSSKPLPEHTHWTGVWNTEKYDSTLPDKKTFVQWLVSQGNDQGLLPLTNLEDPRKVLNNEIVLFTGEKSDQTVKVGKVKIDSVREGDRSYAFWVADEGVKADLSWNEGSFTDADQKQAARLSSIPGPNYGFLGTIFGSISYPLTQAANGVVQKIQKAANIVDLPPFFNASQDWLQTMSHHVTLGSRGVICDVKKGGLRRDLSLAFEMDGSEDDPTKLTNFNTQKGEFVGTGNRASDPNTALFKPMPSANFYQRYLYTYNFTHASGSDTPIPTKTYSSAADDSYHFVRGPCWHALRDYYNLYKRLSGSGSSVTLNARAIYPDKNSAAQGTALTDSYINDFKTNTSEQRYNSVYYPLTASSLYRYVPLKGNYAPVSLGIRSLISIVSVPDATGNILSLGFDPIFYIWNPYNVALNCNNLAITLYGGLPFGVLYKINPPAPDPALNYCVDDMAAALNNNSIWNPSFKLGGSSFTIQPGEVVVFSLSPPSGGTFSDLAASNSAVTGYTVSSDSGYVMKKIPAQSTPAVPRTVLNNANQTVTLSDTPTNNLIILPNGSTVDIELRAPAGRFWYNLSLGANQSSPIQQIQSNSSGPGDGEISSTSTTQSGLSIGNTKVWIGQNSFLQKPTIYSSVPVETFSRFNPLSTTIGLVGEPWRLSPYSMFYNLSTGANINSLLTAGNMSVGAQSGRQGFWGKSFGSSGNSSIVTHSIPRSPIYSLGTLRHAQTTLYNFEPPHPLGNSLSIPYLPTDTLAGICDKDTYVASRYDTDAPWCYDSSWLINDSLWDRYFFSGIAPGYSNGGSYQMKSGSASSGIQETLKNFFSNTPNSALASPSIQPYLPENKTVKEITQELAASDGYKKMGAYSFIRGAFNINSTSIEAWAALLSANQGISVNYNTSGGGTSNDQGSGIPFPKLTFPGGPSSNAWTGFRRLSKTEIWDGKNSGLAAEIVKQNKLRGPFQNLGDFVNRKLSTDTLGYWGAIQAAIQAVNINSVVSGEGMAPNYSGSAKAIINFRNKLSHTGNTSSNIPGSIMQADILEPIAPRLSARSDTFKIRAYGELRSKTDPDQILSKAYCEAIVQRLPEYFDNTVKGNDPWDDGTPQTTKALSELNQKQGRRFKIVQIRWLNPDEI